MKHKVTLNSILSSAILSSAIAMGLFASAGSAQAQSDHKLRANIPFAFQVGSSQVPAGVYLITLQDHRVLLQDQDPNHAAIFLLANPAHGGKIQAKGRLVFHRYGNQYFLREMWKPNSKEGITCTPSSEEKEILRAQNQQSVPRDATVR